MIMRCWLLCYEEYVDMSSCDGGPEEVGFEHNALDILCPRSYLVVNGISTFFGLT
jgi:hypothetical protein